MLSSPGPRRPYGWGTGHEPAVSPPSRSAQCSPRQKGSSAPTRTHAEGTAVTLLVTPQGQASAPRPVRVSEGALLCSTTMGVGTQGSGLRAQAACISRRLRWGAGSTPKAARDLQQHLKAPSPPCPPPPQRLTTAGDPTHGPRRGREQRWFGGQRSLVPPRSSVPQFPRWVQRGGGGGHTIHTDTSTFPLLRGLRSLPPATG